MQHVAVQNITKRFGSVLAVDDVSFEVAEGEFVTLLGPSGCGKTTTLRMIAGLETPSEGTIRIGGEDVTDQPAYERDIGMVFQDYALFPHKTVGENVGFPLKMRGVPADERESQVEDALDLVRLPGTADRSPAELSGGQQQRVALARAMVYEPDVLLMDEPLSALDRVLRQQMRVELKRLQDEVGITTIYVTHDQMEAFSLSDRVLVLDGGELSQTGSPLEIYEEPASEFVGDFIGRSSRLTGTVRAGDPPRIEVGDVALELSGDRSFADGEEVTAFLRAEKLSIAAEPTGEPNELAATVTTMNYLGEKTQFFCTLPDGEELIVAVQGFTAVDDFDPGDTVFVTVPPENVIVVGDGPRRDDAVEAPT
ncbi:MAG: ABC transporter ATP-binding protein [Halanaeroarchaeum sp.]